MNTGANKIFKGGVVLSITALAVRTVGVGFNVYVSGKIGAAGMGLLTLVMSICSLGVTFAVSGVSLAATRMTAEAVGEDKNERVRAAMRGCLIYSASFGCAALILLSLLAKPVALNILGDERCIRPIALFALSMPFVAMSSAMHGYFTALGRIARSASVGLGEQIVKVCVTVMLLDAVNGRGVEAACLAVIGGGTISDIASFSAAMLMYKSDLSKNFPKASGSKVRGTSKKLFDIAFPVALSSYLRTGLVTIEHVLIPRGLRAYGASIERSLELYGILQGMVLPIILFPTAFLASFNMLLVPELARAAARNEKRRIDHIGERFLRYTLIFSLGVSAVMICFSGELGYVIYKNTKASSFIRLLAPLIPVMYFDSAVDSMLKGLDEQLYNMRVNIIDAGASALLVYVLCPRIGIMGYVITVFVSEVFNLSCSFLRLIKVTDIKVNIVYWIFRPMVCALAACTVTRIIFEAVSGVAYSYASLFIHLSVTLAVYLFLLCVTRTLGRSDRFFLKSLVVRR